MSVHPDLLAAHYASGRAAWPQLKLTLERFAAHAQRLTLDEEALALHVEDLFLVFAALEGEPDAVKLLDRLYVRPACKRAARLDSAPTFVDDVAQQVHLGLLAGPEPSLRLYSAAGSLLDWLRIVALRAGFKLKRTDRRRGTTFPIDPVLEELHGTLTGPAPAFGDAEHGAARALHLENFRRALEGSFRQLATRERVLLRLHLVDGLNLDAIGVVYGVHRATVARWLVAIRQTLFKRTQQLLARDRAFDSREVRSLYRLLEPELHLTLSRLLRIDPPDGQPAPVT